MPGPRPSRVLVVWGLILPLVSYSSSSLEGGRLLEGERKRLLGMGSTSAGCSKRNCDDISDIQLGTELGGLSGPPGGQDRGRLKS